MSDVSSAVVAIDVGSVRVGVAACDAGVALAMPVTTLPRDDRTLQRLAEIIEERDAGDVIVGLPLTLAGEEGPSARSARDFAQMLADQHPEVAVRLVDERMTTAQSSQRMREAGRNTRKARSVLDQAAAVAILQNALDRQRTTGAPAGTIVRPEG